MSTDDARLLEREIDALHNDVVDLRKDVRRLMSLECRVMHLLRCQVARWLTIDDASAYTGYSRERLYVLMRSGRLRSVKPFGGKILMKREWIDEFITKNTEEDEIVK